MVFLGIETELLEIDFVDFPHNFNEAAEAEKGQTVRIPKSLILINQALSKKYFNSEKFTVEIHLNPNSLLYFAPQAQIKKFEIKKNKTVKYGI